MQSYVGVPAGWARKLGVIILIAAVFASAGAKAQPAPDPASDAAQQSQQRASELARETAPVQTGDPIITEPVPRAELPAPGGPTILLRTVQFEPASEFLSEQELDAITAQYVGKVLDFSRIASLVRDVNDLYAKKGVVTASAVLPPQTLEGGVLKVNLVEGRLGSVSVVGEHKTSDGFIFDHVRLTRGDNVVDVPTAARDIAWFNQTHSAQLRMLLEPGASFGLTDLSVGVTEPVPNLLQFSVDNQGVKSTGEYQWNASYRGYGLLGIDDNLLASLTGSEGSLAMTLTGDAPIHKSGTRLGLGLTASTVEVVNGAVGQLDVSGKSATVTATLTQPIYADTNWLFSAVGTGSYGVSGSELSGVKLVDTRTAKAALGVLVSYRDQMRSFSIQPQLVVAGIHDNLTSSDRDVLLLTGSADASVDFGDRYRLVARAGYQYTEEKLLPGNLLFQIGGPSTVRGYPSDGVGGDSGYYFQAELHASLDDAIEGLDTFAFMDFGEVFSTYAPRTTFQSVGFGASYSWNDRVTLDLTAAIPVRQSTSDQSFATVYAKLTSKFY